MDFYKRAQQLREETVSHRRFFHEHAEIGLHLPKAVAYVTEELKKIGVEPQSCGHGVTACIGSGSPVLLLRADMDALPMVEESGESFACTEAPHAHACGHDFHAAMLLTAAKLLKEQEHLLKGTVKLMFQPAEETFEGSRDMIEAGILENPKVDAAMTFHVTSGRSPVGFLSYNSHAPLMASVDGFRITVSGKGGHGASPHVTVDPIQIAVSIYQAFETLIAREADPKKTCVLTIGSFHGGTAPNIIPDSVVVEGTLRTNDVGMKQKLVRRLRETAKGIAAVYGGAVEITALSDVPPLCCDPAFTEAMIGYMQQMDGGCRETENDVQTSASEDFALITERVPGALIYISAGFDDERVRYPAHNPKVVYNEAVCPIGAARLAHGAVCWLNDQH